MSRVPANPGIRQTLWRHYGRPTPWSCRPSLMANAGGDPFKDTSSVAMNPVIKFTTLFGLLAVELAVSIADDRGGHALNYILTADFFLVSVTFVWRSFYRMRIESTQA